MSDRGRIRTGRGRGRGRQLNDSVPVLSSRSRGRGASVQLNNSSGVPATSRGRGRGSSVQLNNSTVVPATRGRGRPIVNPVSVEQFVQATSNNLPTITFLNVAEFFQKIRTPEQRHAKDDVSSGADYGDAAIGYVKVKRDSGSCTVEAKITPQTSVNATPYNVSVVVNEMSGTILRTSCNCQASKETCKHKTAMIFWVLRRSEEPSPTEVTCYWRKSHLSCVKGIKAKSIDELSGVCTDLNGNDKSVFEKFIQIGETVNKDSTIVRYGEKNILRNTLYMDHLVIRFEQTKQRISCNKFLKFCEGQMTDDICEKIFEETYEQSSKAQWYYLRFGRITASKLFEASRCRTSEGSLIASIMGSRSFKGNFATKRGQHLEKEIFNLLKKRYTDIRKCGIVLKKSLPQFGASPDGLNDDYVFEIKCPSKTKTIKNYVDNGVLQNKVFYQMQMQMFMCQRVKGVLVIADPEFEKNKKTTEWEVSFDENKLKTVIEDAKRFWEKAVFPILK